MPCFVTLRPPARFFFEKDLGCDVVHWTKFRQLVYGRKIFFLDLFEAVAIFAAPVVMGSPKHALKIHNHHIEIEV